ncbi:hypothetical protein F2P81_000290 [Scophthalmus maximus]|uniref:Protein lifeguard 1-like n=1 Tax=Scophthalmus maximus TaxID=52904 RepID=A0A6A4TIS7_SCOMX|nr:hypothetical protein F2P81_000290 [Scophthalmus maximus]
MSDMAVTSKETQDAPGSDTSAPPPPPYSYQGQQPPPYTTDPAMYFPPKTEATCINQPGAGYICPEAQWDETPIPASSSFDDKTVRRAFVRKVVVTLSMSYMVGTIASFHDTTAVVITIGATLAITLAIIAFSAQTRYDFTICYGVLLILAVDLIMFCVFCTFYYSYVADVAYGCLGALLFSLCLLVDCQLMMGAMSYRLDPEEYVNAALMLYLDVVLIFLYLLGRK